MSSLALLPAVAVGASLLVVSGVLKLRGGGVRPAMRLAGAVETALGIVVLVAPTRPATAALAIAYCLFAGIVEWQRRQPGITSCGCLGGSAPPSRAHTGLDLGLAAAAGGAAWLGGLPPPSVVWSDSPSLTLVAAAGIAFATTLAAAVIRDLPELLSSYQAARQ